MSSICIKVYAVATICGGYAISIHEEGVNFLGFAHLWCAICSTSHRYLIVPTRWTFVHPTDWVSSTKGSDDVSQEPLNGVDQPIRLIPVRAVSALHQCKSGDIGGRGFDGFELLHRAVFVVSALHEQQRRSD